MGSKFVRNLGTGLALLALLGLSACGRPAAPGSSAPAPPPAAPSGGAAAPAPAKAPAAPAIEMKIGHATANDAQDSVAKFFAKEVERLSGGRIKAPVFNASQLGNNEKMNKDIRSGAQEVLIQPTGFASPYISNLAVLDLPYLFPSDEVQTQVLNSPAAAPMLKAAEGVGVEIIGFFGGGVKDMVTTFPIAKADDLKGRKIRVIQSPELMGQFKAFGSIAVPMALNEVYTGLQQKAVEGVELPPDVVYGLKFHEVAKNFTRTLHGHLNTFIMVNKKWMDSLPADLQKAVRDAGKSAANEALKTYQNARKGAEDNLAKLNIKVVELPAAERATLKAAGQAVWEETKKNAAKAEVMNSLTKAIAGAAK